MKPSPSSPTNQPSGSAPRHGATERQRLCGGSIGFNPCGFSGIGFWLRPKPAILGDHVPDVRTLGMNTVEHAAKVDPAGLAAAMVLHQRPKRVEVDAEAGQQAEQ